MEKYSFGTWFVIMLLVQGSETHSLNTGEEHVCPSTFSYNLMMLNKMNDIEKDMTGIEKEIRDTVRSLTEHVLQCSDSAIKSCPEDSYKSGKSCYHFSDEILTWADAMEKCVKNFGGYLAVINDREENTYLKGIARSRGSKADRLWLGGSDAFKEGEWRWMTTMERISVNRVTDWYVNEPKNDPEHCLELYGGYDFQWNDEECFNRHYYICEKDL